MHIFIDESGTFTRSAGKPGVSVVGALVIPGKRLAKVERKYAAMRARFTKERGEVKGRLLDEAQVASVIDLLARNECLFELVAIDMNMHEAADIQRHQAGQAQGTTNQLTDQHHPNVRRQCAELAAKILALAPQLYVQSVALFELVWQTCEHAINFYAQRRPEELAAFYWTLDAKDRKVTNWETLWADIVLPILQSKSIRQPHGLFEGGDYRHFKRFEGTAPDWLPKPERGSSGRATDIRLLLMEHFRYSPDSEPGLELADIVVSAARRALIGNLRPAGWAGLPGLIIHHGRQYIHLIALHERELPERLAYERVLRRFSRGGRSMLAPRFLRDEAAQ